MTVGSFALAVHVVGTAFMCGLNWLVQIVHYPLFPFVDGSRWSEFHAEHSRRISWVVGLPWGMQGFGAFALLAWRPDGLSFWLAGGAVVLASATVFATVGLAIPAHIRLADGFSQSVHRRLVVTNWVRTIVWTAATLLVMVMVTGSLDG